MENKDSEQILSETDIIPDIPVLSNETANPLWLSVSETAKVCGINTRTIRRAMTDKKVKFKIINGRYLIDLRTVIRFLYITRKLRNKLNTYGVGQFVREWRT